MIEETQLENIIETKKIAQNEQTLEPNGTKIYINDLNIKINKMKLLEKLSEK